MRILDLLDRNAPSAPEQQAVITRESPVSLGLSSKQAQDLLQKNGKNILSGQKKISAIKIFANQFKDIMTLILLVCTAISVTMGEFVEAIAIGIIVLMNGLLGFFQEYRTEKTLDALKRMASPMAKVYRDGRLCSVASSDIVEGDAVMLETGDKIPADGVLQTSVNLYCDESMLTGESVPVAKLCSQAATPKPENMVYMGCSVSKGHGVFLVSETAMETKMGSIASMLRDIDEEKTPLQARLAKLSKAIAIGCIIICAVVTLTGILRGEAVLQMLITGISLAVAAVPEGLPAIVTISLALSVSRMVKRQALVRRLHAVETLGCATVICSDKTGTLTQNKMTATSIYIDGKNQAAEYIQKSLTCDLTLKAIALCNNASVEGKTDYGDHTEICLLNLAKKHGYKKPTLDEEYSRLSEQPFDSIRKCMSVIVSDKDGTQYSFVKGGIDILLPQCSSILSGGTTSPLGSVERRRIEKENDTMADSALRVICIAYKKIGPLGGTSAEQQLTFLALIGMMDPPRKEARPAVLACSKAGIKTVMITGDHRNTAIAIATQVSIYHKGDMVLSGYELDNMPFERLCEIVGRVSVFARVSPANKLTIVRALKHNGHIVAMTGDGVNDAPAIKEADIGVSMGIGGTDVTREASEIILLDDNFATLVSAIDEGRSIYNNIRKFIRYLLACNIGEVVTMFLGMLMGMPIILFPIQILLVNLVTDGLPAIALGLEPSDKRAMSVPPRKPKEGVFSNGLATKIVIRGILIGLTTLASFVTLFRISGSEDVARSGALFALIFAQLIHVFECKSEEKGIFSIPFFNNIKLILASSFSLLILLLVLYAAPLQAIFSVVPLTFRQVLIPIGFCLLAPIVSGLIHRNKAG